MKTKLDVLYQSSDEYCSFACVSIVSLLENNKNIEEINIYLMEDNIAKDNIEKIRELVFSYGRNIIFIDATDIDKELSSLGIDKYNGSYATYYKLFSLRYIPNDVQRIIYIDSDTIIIHSLEKLLEIEMREKSFAMAPGIMFGKYKVHLGLSKEQTYYNAGVIVFNVERYKQEKLIDRIVSHLLDKGGGYAVGDESILNVLFAHEIVKISLSYNVPSFICDSKAKDILYAYDKYGITLAEIEEGIKHPIIYHLSGGVVGRPWEEKNINPQKRIYYRYLKKTSFKEQKPILIKKSFIKKIQRFIYSYFPKKIYYAIFKILAERQIMKKEYELEKRNNF